MEFFCSVSWTIKMCRIHENYEFFSCFSFVFASLVYGEFMGLKWKLITTYEVERKLRLHCVRIAVVAPKTLGFQSKNCYAATMVGKLSVQKFMATIFCKIWVQILLCAKLIRYTVPGAHVIQVTIFFFLFPIFADRGIRLIFAPAREIDSVTCHQKIRQKLKILTVILGRLLDYCTMYS